MRQTRFCASKVLLFTSLLWVSPAASADIPDLIQQYRTALARNDLIEAADAATRLDKAIRGQYRAFLIRDAGERVAEALRWLPPNVESLLVQQAPVPIEGDNFLAAFAGRPVLPYTLGRLMAVNHGETYKRLSGQMVRLIVAGVSNLHGGSGGIPGAMPDADAAYIYFLAQPVETELFGPPAMMVVDHPVWRGLSTRGPALPRVPGVEQNTRQEDETWLSLPRSDVIIVATKRELLTNILARIEHSVDRALPDNLPEWANVDRKAPFWGIRHYANPGSPGDETNPLNSADQQGPSDKLAVGVTAGFYPDRETVEICYLSGGEAFPLRAFRHVLNQFDLDRSRKGISRMTSNTRERGAFPLNVALHLLGFGL